MIRRNIWIVVLALLGVWNAMGCSGPETPTGACTTTADCKKGERCLRRICTVFIKKNEPPEAVVGKNQRVRLNTVVSLDGSKSSDPEKGKLTFAWSFAKRPDKSKAIIKDDDKAKASLKADVPGLYIVKLIVKDVQGSASQPAQMEVEVYGKDENGDPIANAGLDNIGCVGDAVKLDGSNSSDPDGDTLQYKWVFKSKPDGSSAALDKPTEAKPSFKADKAGKYVLELVVNDGLEASPSDTVTIQVLSDCKLQPKLTSLSPNEGFIDGVVQVKIKGEGFSEQAAIVFNGTDIPVSEVTFVSPTELNVRLSLVGVIAKKYQIKVRNPNQKESNELPFDAKELPTPTLTKLTPPGGIAGAKMEIKAIGTGFTKKTEALFNLVPLKTTYVNDKELTFILDLSQTPVGVYKVKMSNPGGRSSKELSFKVGEAGPAPILRVLNPPTGVTDTKIPFSVHGIGFAPGSEIVFNGKKIPSKRIRRDEIQAYPSLDLTGFADGQYKVYVRNPDGKKSNEETFTVEGKDPKPVLDRILPFFVYINDANNKLAVYGLKFRKGLKLKIGNHVISGADIAYKSSTYFEATVDTTKGTWAVGDLLTTVENPNGKVSGSFKITVTYRIPSLTGLTPSGWTTGCDTNVTVSGSNFIRASQLKIGNLTFTTTSTTNKLTFVSDEKMTFPLKKGALSTGTHQVQVINASQAKSGNLQFYMTSASSVPTPEIREIRPSSGRADSKVGLIMYYNGSNRFWNGAIVYLDGKPQKTTCSSSGTTCYNLGVELDLTGFKPGKHDLTVKNPCGKASKSFPFYVAEAPSVYISSISPSFARPGDKKKFVISGLKFSKNAVLNWGGKTIPVIWKSDKELITTGLIDFSAAKAGDVIDVFVDNKNGKKTPTIKFSVLDKNAKLYITSLSTTSFLIGGVYKGLQISGSGFTSSSEVYFNGQKISSQFTSQYQVIANGLDFKSLKAGSYELYVKDGANVSNKVVLFGKPNQEPVLSYIRPSIVYSKTPSVSFYVYGKYFCQPQSASSSYCNSASYKVKIFDPNNKDVSSSFNISRAYYRRGWSYDGYAYGSLNTSSWANGVYKVYFELPTGERSIAAVMQIKPPPAPVLTSVSPAGAKKGVSQKLYLNGSYLVRGATVLIGLQSFVSTSGSSGGGSYLYATINTTNLSEGTHPLTVRNPDGQVSNALSFIVYPKTVSPLIQYTRPDVAYSGFSGSFYVYGENLTASSKVYVNGKVVSGKPYFYQGSSYAYLRYSGWKAPVSKGDYKVYVTDSLLNKSNEVTIKNAGTKPFIRYISPDSRYSTSSSYSGSVYVYGFGFDATSKILIDGTAYTPSYRGSSYIRLSHLFSGYKDYKVQVKNGNGDLSNEAIFSFVSSLGMTISYTRASYVTAGETVYTSGSFYISGKNFTKTSKIYLDGKMMKTRYSSSSRMYVDETLDFRQRTKAGISYWQVRDGAKKSNLRAMRIETGVTRLNLPKFTKIEPSVVASGAKITLNCSTSYIYSSNYQSYQAVIVGQGLTKIYPIAYIGGRYSISIDTTGWKKGVYNVYAENKVTKLRSGGTGLYVFK